MSTLSPGAPARPPPPRRPARPTGPTSRSATAAGPSSPGSRRSAWPSCSRHRVGRRVHGRLLRARFRLEARPRQLLEERFPTQAGDTVDVVVHADGGLQDASAQAAVAGPACRARPRCPTSPRSPTRTHDPAGISPDGTTLVAHLRLDVENPVDMPIADSERMLDARRRRRPRDGLQVALGGQSIQQAEQGEIGSEGIGLAAATIILLLMFGSVVAAGLPILVAVAGLAVSSTLTDGRHLLHRRPGLVDVAGHDDGHRHRHRLRAADGDPLPRVAGRRAGPRGRHRRHPRHRRPLGHGRRHDRGDQHARPVRHGPVVHARSGRRHDPRRPGRDGRQRHPLPRAPGLPRQAHRPAPPPPRAAASTVEVAAGGHVVPSRGWLPGAGSSTGTASSPPSSASASCWRSPSPFLDVRFGFPDAGNNREETSTPSGLRPAGRGLRPRHERPARSWSPSCPQVTEPRPSRASPPPSPTTPGVAAVSPATAQPRRRHRRHHGGPHRRAAGPRDRGPGHHPARRRAPAAPPTARASSSTSAASRRPRSTAPTTSPSGCRCSSAAWCCSRCCCWSCRSARSRSR